MNNEKKAPRQLPGSDNQQTYQKPVLTVLGDLRTLTLAPSQVPEIESELGTVYGYPIIGPEGINDQFEGRTGRKTDSSGGGRSGRG